MKYSVCYSSEKMLVRGHGRVWIRYIFEEKLLEDGTRVLLLNAGREWPPNPRKDAAFYKKGTCQKLEDKLMYLVRVELQVADPEHIKKFMSGDKRFAIGVRYLSEEVMNL